MKSIQHKLLLQFWIPIIICLILVILYENELLLPAAWQSSDIGETYAGMVMELLTICLIPLSLRLFKFKFVTHRFEADAPSALLQWGSVRMLMLSLPMLFNTFLYYQFMNVAFGYMGIIGLLSMMFVYPSRSRCEAEGSNSNGQ